MLTRDVPLSEIDLLDTEYRLFDSGQDPKLENSVSSFGLINPVKLIKKKEKYSVISGWKRLKAITRLNVSTVLSQVYETNELTPLQIYSYIYLDNKDRFTDIEKAELLNKLILSDSMAEEEIINDILPLLGLNPSSNNLNKYKSISRLEPELKEECYKENISFEQLQLLSEIDDPEFRSGFYNNFLKNYKFNNNEARDLLKDVQAICIRGAQSIDEFAKEILKNNNEKQDKNIIRKLVKTKCYPRLTGTEQKYNEMVKKLDLGNTSRLINHPYFESNDLELRIKFKEKNGLSDELEKLKESVENGKIEELLKLIKEGK